MSDLQSLAASLAGRAQSSEEVEAFVTHEKSFNVKVYSGEVESLSSAEPRGAGVRVVSGGRVGFAYTTDLDEKSLDRLVVQARDNAGHSTPDEAVALATAWAQRPPTVSGLVDDSQVAVSSDDKVAFALELERATRSLDPRIRAVEEAVYSDSDAEIGLATSTGIAGFYRRTDAWCYSLAIATEDDDTEIGFEFDLARGIAALDAEAVGRAAAERALGVLGAGKIPSGRMPVVFEPYVAGQFLGVLGSALVGEAVQKGRSLLAARLGEQIAAPGLTMVDDGRREGAPGAAP